MTLVLRDENSLIFIRILAKIEWIQGKDKLSWNRVSKIIIGCAMNEFMMIDEFGDFMICVMNLAR